MMKVQWECEKQTKAADKMVLVDKINLITRNSDSKMREAFSYCWN